MLRHNDTIRLTPEELNQFNAVAGKSATPPKTVTEHNDRLEAAAEVFEEGESPEEKLAAMLARDMLLD